MFKPIDLIISILSETWALLLDASPYILFGILVAGFLRMFLSTDYVVRNLGEGRVMPVLKASLMGIPIPLCSCGVIPAAASLRRQGASKGATTAFLISTPESGVDSIAVSWALLDPVMTVARPVVAFITATLAGLAVSFFGVPETVRDRTADNSCAVDGCCDGDGCDPVDHANHHLLSEKVAGGMKYAFGELWGDLAGWFAAGLILAGIVTSLVPDQLIASTVGGGLGSMLIMLAVGVPLYLCATASTPIAAALILKGVSPGAALVFLLVGPATNIASLSVLTGLLGRRAVGIYLASIAAVSIVAGLVLDFIYTLSGISARAAVGQAAELVPVRIQYLAAAVLIAISIRPLASSARGWWGKIRPPKGGAAASDCGCMGSG
ncbi:MAG: SO_0444 family Cu/Zn efflux transporter [bacterium]|nr:SO_0444 family Cu/Zn efflux transporter [bacterium]MDT8395577.1 SO_0444 family Cu/Zn efflux transporter [bacterium]